MRGYIITLRLSGPLSEAVAVEWVNQPAPLDSAQGWEPCLRLPDGTWRFSSHDLSGANPPHRLGPGVFRDLAIRYRLSAAGPWLAASESRKEIVILDVTEEAGDFAPPVAPVLVAAPLLTGTGMVGAEVTVSSGFWSAESAPRIAFQWRRDGTLIAGAVARVYVPGSADDLTDLDCLVTARNAAGAGEAVAVTPALRITYPAPAAIRELPEEIFDQAPGAQLVETEFAFAGANLTFAAAGAVIDPRTGVLTIPTERPLSGQVVTVTAMNSGGAASARLRVTVEAVPPWPLETPDVRILRSVWRPDGQTGLFTPIVAFPGLAGERVGAIQWTAATALDVELNWHPCVARPSEAGTYDLFATSHPLLAGVTDPALFSTTTEANRARLSLLRFRWRRASGSEWSQESDNYTVPLPQSDSPTPIVLQSSIDFGGGAVITLSKAMGCGQYNNGEWFVVNPEGGGGFSVTSFTPASSLRGRVSGTGMHGLMLNPLIGAQGFDSLTHGGVNLRSDYNDALNIDPGKAGARSFAAGAEGSLVKAVSLASPTSTASGGTIYDRMIVVTVVKDVPKANSFRPSMHGSVTSKASIATTEDLALNLIPLSTIDVSGIPTAHSLTNVLQRFKGPWPTWVFSDRRVRQLWAVQSTHNVSDALYGPNVALAVTAAIGYLCNSGTSAANRLELLKRIVQIGIDYGQPAKSVAQNAAVFWPESFASSLIIAQRMLPSVTQLQGKLGTMLAGDDPWKVNTTVDDRIPGRQWRYITDTEVGYIPPQGIVPSAWVATAEADWPMFTPFLPEHKGEPWGKFSGGRSGISADINAEYRPNHSQSTLTFFLASALGGGTSFFDFPPLVGYCDRLQRIRSATMAGTLPDQRDGKRAWQQWHLNIFNALRPSYSTPVYVGPPEQPDPPVLTRNSASSLTIAMTAYQPNGGSPIIRRQYRIRTRSANSQAQVFEAWTGGWTNFGGSVTLTGLPVGWRQVQVRTVNLQGASPPSTNVASIGSAPDAYRGIIIL